MKISKMAYPFLTPRQHEVLALMADGLSTKEISTKLSLSKNTVRNTKYTLYKRLGAQTGEQAIMEGIRRGFIDES